MRYVTLTTVKGKAKSAPPDNRKPQAWFSLLLESFMSTSTIMISSMYQKIDLCNEVQEIKEQIFRSIINQLLYNSIYNEVVEKFLKNRIRMRNDDEWGMKVDRECSWKVSDRSATFFNLSRTSRKLSKILQSQLQLESSRDNEKVFSAYLLSNATIRGNSFELRE